ncbi:HAMP domain-containing sensor histidine kinase [Paenibacillus sp. YPG26]|uniref:sensor histidine kinase n=1 Tax=Paenibacillus sp. YPG26 TaxID=2878915 RepID=UPI00203A68F2|nr:HAMP domain-containing sensor histidine kinase [Paenibacillus sp. YPG26]USB35109.1 HAMP domain-containing histidine kinase [Paenibacillus sp. YPG26]
MKRAREFLSHPLAPGSLRSQLLVRSLFILAALLILIGGLQYWLMKDFLYKSRAEGLRAQIMSIPKGLLRTQGELSAESDQDRQDQNRKETTNLPESSSNSTMDKEGRPFVFRETSLALISKDGSFTDVSGEFGMKPPRLSTAEYTALMNVHQDNRSHRDYVIARDPSGKEQLIVAGPAGPPSESRGLIQMGTSTAPLQEQLLQQLFIFLVLSALALAGGLLLYIPVLRRTLVPLSRMVEVVGQTDAGNLAERFPAAQGQVEIDRLSASFNGMLERLELSFEAERESKERMRQFIADASHELRTPLTSIHGFLEVLLRGAAANPQKLQAALTSMHGESRRINKLVEDLLLLTKLDQAPQLQLTELCLDALLREMEPQLLMLAGQRNVRFDLTAHVQTKADPDKIKQVVLNLFHNAVQHTHETEGVITVTLIVSENQAELTVQDNGSGIHPEHLPHIFDRFYRSESSRTRKSGGAGLGLAITKSIMDAHKGTITARSEPGLGTSFRITLPIVK